MYHYVFELVVIEQFKYLELFKSIYLTLLISTCVYTKLLSLFIEIVCIWKINKPAFGEFRILSIYIFQLYLAVLQ